MLRKSGLIGGLALSLLLPGCAETLARQSSRGAIAAIKEKGHPSTMVEHAARAVAAGTIEAMTSQERRAALKELSHDVASAVARGIHTGVRESIGAEEGILAEQLATVFPDCATATNRTVCIQRVLERITQMTATGLVRAVRRELGLPALVAAFVAGVLCTLVVVFVVSMLQTRRRIMLHPAARPA
jgi:hypothetical protein